MGDIENLGMVPIFGLPELRLIEALGLSLTVSLLTSEMKYDPDADGEKTHIHYCYKPPIPSRWVDIFNNISHDENNRNKRSKSRGIYRIP